LGFTDEDVPALLQLAQDEEALQDEDALINSAPYHAWRILGLLKAESATLPLFAAIIDDDWSTEDGPAILGLIGEKAIEPIKQCLTGSATDDDKKGILVAAFGEIIKNNPEYREQGVVFFTEYLAKITDKDSSLAGFVICVLIDMNARESIEAIRAAFKRNCVDISIAGDIEEVEIEMDFRQRRAKPKPNYHGLREMDDDEIFGVVPKKVKPFVQPEPTIKVGRNDPCPCGSGKKYKKCCLH
jgi:hypothetical protein